MTTENDYSALIRQARDAHDLQNKDVAELLHVSPETVRAWMKLPSSRGHNPPPLMAVELLYRKLGLPLPRLVKAGRAAQEARLRAVILDSTREEV